MITNVVWLVDSLTVVHSAEGGHSSVGLYVDMFCVIYLKTGNDLMRQEEYSAAVESYTQAIQLDSRNAVYYCNRSVLHFFLEIILCRADERVIF